MGGLLRLLGCSVDLFAERAKGLPGEDGFNGQAEEFAGAESELEAGVVIAAFHVAYGLVVDAESVGEVPTALAALSAEDADAVVEGVGGIDLGCRHRSERIV